MKTKIFGILICMLMIIPVLATAAVATNQDSTLSACLMHITVDKKITFIVRNWGTDEVFNVPWSIELKKSIGNGPLSYYREEGVIDHIAPDEAIQIHSDSFFGLIINTEVIVKFEGEVVAKGLRHIIGPLVIYPMICEYIPEDYNNLYSDFKAEIIGEKKSSEIQVSITNIGDEVRTDVSWLIHFPLTHFFQLPNHYFRAEGIIESISPGETINVSSGQVSGGLHLSSNIMVIVDGYGGDFEWRHILGSTFIIPKYTRYRDPC